ncbi:MAG: S10 family peptidase [Chitinophagaceae bacterium]
MKKLIFLLSFFASIFLSNSIQAQPSPVADTAIPAAYKSVTHRSIKIDNKLINYTATAGFLILKNAKDSAVAAFGYTAYTKDGETDASKRPLTFAYNGGPGSSSMWLHMGALGPRRVVVNDPQNNPPPPYNLEDNNNSIIDVTDLVMIDPVGTGLSHAVGNAKNKDFWGVDRDIESISQFIKQFVTDNGRWNSPKYLLGESYGTMRSAGIVDYLQDNIGMAMNGVILISNVLDLRSLTFQQGDDISYILHLPTYAAVAWYHNKIANKPANLESFLNDVRNFAGGEYASALMKGDDLSDAEKDAVLSKLSEYTGLSKDYLLKGNLRINEPQFTQELLRENHEIVGRLDSRYKGISQDLLGEYSSDDPQSSQISPAFTATFMNYYYEELKVNKIYNYHTSAYSAEGFDWDWKHRKNGGSGDPVTPNTGVDLAEAMSKNPNLKILVLNGYYDLATPFYATEYTFDHLRLEKKLKANITLKYYEAGHMMYINPSVIPQFKKDIADFILSTSK